MLSLAWLARETLAAPIAGGEEDGPLGAAIRPAVALPNDQGTHILDVKEEGAQQSFDLFYPQLPSLNVKKETSTSVPVIHLPAEHEDDLEKVAADALLDMFPQDLLENNKKVRPVDVKIIEHDGYIDYEIEFVEIPDYYEYYDEETIETKQSIETLQNFHTSFTTEKPTPEKTFVDLLKKARSKHRQQNQSEKESFENSSLSDRATDIVEDETKTIEQDTENTGKGGQQNLGNLVHSQSEIEDREIKLSSRRRSTTSARPDTDKNANNENDDDDAVAVPQLTSTDASLTLANSMPETPRSSQEGTKQVQEKLSEDETLMVNEENHEKPTEEFEQFSDDFLVSESKSNLQLFTGEETLKNNPEDQSEHEQTTSATVTENYDYDNNQPSYTNSERVPKLISSDSSEAQLFQDSVDEKEDNKEQSIGGNYHEVSPGQYHEVNPGQYHEINPGQYHEVNPGQDHEVNPGQDHEVNPGQYHEVNPGQYHEENPGQYRVDDDDIQVSVDDNSEDDSRTYDVRANAGDFIIGEVGKIDINSGQTLEGVRYTALESEVNYEKIKEILEMYFGARTA